MKNLILIFILSLSSSLLSFANTEPNIISKNILATSGLKLRVTPGLDGSVLKIIDFGEKVEILETTSLSETIEWRTGYWVKVKHEGEEGYLFDGFLSKLPIPTQRVAADSDLEMSVPLMAWLEENYQQDLTPDTLINESIYKLTKYYGSGNILTVRNNDYANRVTLEMQGVSIEDMYNLLISLVAKREDRSVMLENSTFIAHRSNGINKIKIQGYYPIVITKTDESNIKVEITSFELGC